MAILSLMSSHNLRADPGQLRKRVGKIPPLLKLLTKANAGDKGAAALGLFPHALKKLVCDKHPDGVELSRDIIRACSTRFRQYQMLSAQADKYRQGNGIQNPHKCLDPFHFLEPLRGRLLTLRSTCVCDLIKGKRGKKNKKSNVGRKAGKQAKRRKASKQAKWGEIKDLSGLDLKYSQPLSQDRAQGKIRDFLIPCPGVT